MRVGRRGGRVPKRREVKSFVGGNIDPTNAVLRFTVPRLKDRGKIIGEWRVRSTEQHKGWCQNWNGMIMVCIT